MSRKTAGACVRGKETDSPRERDHRGRKKLALGGRGGGG